LPRAFFLGFFEPVEFRQPPPRTKEFGAVSCAVGKRTVLAGPGVCFCSIFPLFSLCLCEFSFAPGFTLCLAFSSSRTRTGLIFYSVDPVRIMPVFSFERTIPRYFFFGPSPPRAFLFPPAGANFLLEPFLVLDWGPSASVLPSVISNFGFLVGWTDKTLVHLCRIQSPFFSSVSRVSWIGPADLKNPSIDFPPFLLSFPDVFPVQGGGGLNCCRSFFTKNARLGKCWPPPHPLFVCSVVCQVFSGKSLPRPSPY